MLSDIKEKCLKVFNLFTPQGNIMVRLSQHTFEEKMLIYMLVISSMIIVVLGSTSSIHLGDEPVHYLFAKSIYLEKKWPQTFGLICDNPFQGPIINDTPMLWHTGLALAWWLWGNASQTVAQGYQVGFFILLIICTFLAAQTLYSTRIGLYSAIILACMPVVSSHSILLFVDIPLAALTMLCFLLLIKKKHLAAGVVAGLMFLTKSNAYFMVPAFVVLAFLNSSGTNNNKLKQLLPFLVPMILIGGYDLYSRYSNFGAITYVVYPEIKPLYQSKDTPFIFVHPASIKHNPINIIKYIGPMSLISLVIYICLNPDIRKNWSLWLPIVSYCIFFVYFFEWQLPARNLSPVFPFLAVIGGMGLSFIKRKWPLALFISLCVAQFIASSYYAYEQRHIPKGLAKAYKYIEMNTPEDCRIMAVEGACLTLNTNRRCMWNSPVSLHELPYLLWKADNKEMLNILNRYGINYILVGKARVYDDSNIHQIGGYPKSFVDRLPSFSCLRLIYENKDASLWQILRN